MMKRTNYNTDLNQDHIGARAVVSGWVAKRRDKGALMFIDLRDRTGIIQLVFDEGTDREVFRAAEAVRAEYVIAAAGTVRSRGEAVNHSRKTGAIELYVDEFEIISRAQTPPFEIEDRVNVNDELRLKYRYLDLRRPSINGNILFRHKIQRITRDYFYDNGFIDIETPNLIKQTPEGARDYIVPSRVHKGCYYALPQSPQLYKQLLMLAGFDRYFQIARCYRDEDLRADRQPEFTQIDLEMSFVNEEDIYAILEDYMSDLFKKTLDIDLPVPFPRLTYKDAMSRFGSDKPDLRFGYELTDLSDTVKDFAFPPFADALAGGSVRAILLNGAADKISRKDMDKLTDLAKTYRAGGLAWYKYTDPISSSYAKALSDEENAAILSALNAKPGDVILIVADKNDSVVFDALGALRVEAAKRLGVIKEGDFALAWVVEFPMFEYAPDENRYYAKHHPFTQPMNDDIHLFDTTPEKIRARAYDIVGNGQELGGGSIRINDPALQKRVLEFLGYTPEMVEERFGFLVEAYKYGAPNHGGLAFGFDRLVALLLGLNSIRDVIAFPKVQNASELMSGAPGEVEQGILDELGIK